MGKIVTLSGPSGAGKTTIAEELLRRNPDWKIVTSLTSRDPRVSDLPGEYRCNVSQAEFRKREQFGEFIWLVSVHGNRYGTLYHSINRAQDAGHISLMLLTPNVISILLNYARGKVLPFFIVPPGEQVLRKRLKKRGEEDRAITKRITDCARWTEEARASGIPYIFIENHGTVAEAASRIEAIISSSS